MKVEIQMSIEGGDFEVIGTATPDESRDAILARAIDRVNELSAEVEDMYATPPLGMKHREDGNLFAEGVTFRAQNDVRIVIRVRK